MTLESVVHQLRNRLGLDPASLGPQAVPLAVAARQRVVGLADIGSYAARVRASTEEFEALTEELVVAETWFFRGAALFPYLVQTIRTLVAERHADKPVRILSVPCSTGEEPYSLSIALAEAAVPLDTWRLDAVDLSSRHLERAKRGSYGKFSFRQTEPALRKTWFRQIGKDWAISDAVKSNVHFRRGNLASPDFLNEESPYDVILCRNLLIYLHDAARRQALSNLDRLLAPLGVICMGHAEPLSRMNPAFCSTGPEGAFAFRRGERPGRIEDLPKATLSAPPLAVSFEPSSSTPDARKSFPADRPPTPGADSPVDALATARRLADAGDLAAAAAECQAQLAAGGPSAELYTLWGTIGQARHEYGEAKSCYQKALYLQPDHRDALWHLMALCEQEGAAAAAQVLRRRFERCVPGGET